LKNAFPEQPLLVLAVAFILAHCSLASIWWVRSNWSAHTKSIAAALAIGCLWLLLVQLLHTARESGPATLAWGACIALQVTLTGLAVMILELSIGYHRAAARSRFSLQYLLVWTTFLAIALGVAGAAAGKSGFQLADVPTWEFFAQLQGVAVASSSLAAAVYASIRLSKTWLLRGLACAVAAIASAVLAPLCLLALFDEKAGAPFIDLVWLFGAHALFFIPGTMYSVLSTGSFPQSSADTFPRPTYISK
jgi:hypothetical protein